MKNKKIVLKENIQKKLILINTIILFIILLLSNKININLLNILNIIYYLNIMVLLKFGNLQKILKGKGE